MAERPHYQLWIDGTWCEGAEGQVMASQNPATGQDWASFACAAPADVDRAVAAARRVLGDPAWRDLSATGRGKLLYRLADLIAEHAQEIGRIETVDSGKLLAETASQTAYVADYYRYYAGLADKIEGAVLPIDKPDMQVFTRPEPIGVVAAIVPWNAQMFLTATKLGPALAAGCAVVLKASEVAPAPMLEFARLIEAAGFPPGVMSVITGDAEGCAIPLTRHPDVDRIAFTGGPETARHVVRNSAENFAVTTLELGGKSPILVFEDADLDSAANGLIAGNFGASGQSCVAGSRGLVQRSVLAEITERITARMADVVLGDPLDPATHLGPLATPAQIAGIEAALAQARAQGAEVVFGGAALDRPGNYMAPTLLKTEDPATET
ncbi:MAG: aldehyde dehydrogenase family protein, partial [Pseudomonadota bacterium]